MPFVALSRRRSMPAVLALAGLVAFAPGASAITYGVSMEDDHFISPTLTIAQGSRVRWTNNGAHDHNTVSEQDFWASPENMTPGQTYLRTFNAAGTFKYLCTLHSGSEGNMYGKVTVPLRVAATGRDITVKLSVIAAPTGYRHQLQWRKATSSTWTLVSTTAKSLVIHVPTAGTYEFRARYERTSTGLHSNWSPIKPKTVS